MQRILLTGSSGLIGKAVKRIYDNGKYNFELLTPSSNQLDLLNYDSVNCYFTYNKGISVVIHCAAMCVGIEHNVSNPINILYRNIEMDKNLITNALNFGVKNLLYMGSSSMYPANRVYELLKEEYLFTGSPAKENEGYAYSKILGAKACEMVSDSCGVHYKTLLLPNVYGIDHKYEGTCQHLTTAVVTKVVEAIEKNSNSITIWGDGNNRRELIFVDDLAEYILHLCSNDCIKYLPQNINLGANKDYSINEYYKITAKVFGYTGTFEYDLDKPAGVYRRTMDSTLAITKHGWNSHTILEDGIKMLHEYLYRGKN